MATHVVRGGFVREESEWRVGRLAEGSGHAWRRVVSNGCQILGFCSQRAEEEASIYDQFLKTKARFEQN